MNSLYDSNSDEEETSVEAVYILIIDETEKALEKIPLTKRQLHFYYR